MRKIFVLLFFLLVSNNTAYANFDDQQPSYEEIYKEWGYTNLNNAIDSFESKYYKELKLPLRLPPLAFTHQFGKVKDRDGEINDSLEIQLVNENHPENHYKIVVRQNKNAVKINEKELVDTYKLEDGSIASYIKIGPPNQNHFCAIVIQRNGWQYILSVDERVTDTVTPEVLVNIANTL